MLKKAVVSSYVAELENIDHVTIHDNLEEWCKQDLEADRREDATFYDIASAAMVSMLGLYPAMTVSDIQSAAIGMQFLLEELFKQNTEIIDIHDDL